MNQPISAMYFISMNSTKRPCLVFTDEPWGNRSIGPSSFIPPCLCACVHVFLISQGYMSWTDVALTPIWGSTWSWQETSPPSVRPPSFENDTWPNVRHPKGGEALQDVFTLTSATHHITLEEKKGRHGWNNRKIAPWIVVWYEWELLSGTSEKASFVICLRIDCHSQ